MTKTRDYLALEFDYFDLTYKISSWRQLFAVNHKNHACILAHSSDSNCLIVTMPKPFYRYLRLHRIRLNGAVIHIGSHTLLYRCSFNSLGDQSVYNNAKFINNNLLLRCPSYVTIISTHPYAISAEELLPGKIASINEWHDSFSIKISKLLEPLFTKTHLSEVLNISNEFSNINKLSNDFSGFLIESLRDFKKIATKNLLPNRETSITKAIIHGDLTFRNIIVSNNALSLIDLDRSTITFPEFDYFLLGIDLLLYKHPSISYKSLIDIAIKMLLVED